MLLGNPNMRDALRTAHEMGCDVREKPRNGEVVISHPRWSKAITCSNHRKDTPRVLVVALRRLLLAKDDVKQVDVQLVKDVVDDEQLFAPAPAVIEREIMERQSAPAPGEERVTLEEAAALVDRPFATVKHWIWRDKLDVGYDPQGGTIAASGLDVLDHLSRTRRRLNFGEGAKFFPPKPEQLSLPNEVIQMNTPAQQPARAPTVTVIIRDDEVVLAKALGLSPEEFVRMAVEQSTKRLREKLRAMMTEAA